MLVQIAKALYYTSCFSVTLPLFFFLLKAKRNFKIPVLQILFIFLVVGGFSDLTGYILMKAGTSIVAIDNIYSIAEFLLLSSIYFLLLKDKRIIYAGIILYTAFSLINDIWFQPFYVFQNWPLIIECAILIVYAVNFYRQWGKKIKAATVPEELEYSISSASFWFNMGVVYYFAFSFFWFATANYFFKHMSAADSIVFWSFTNLNNIIKNVVFAIAICFSKSLVKPLPKKKEDMPYLGM